MTATASAIDVELVSLSDALALGPETWDPLLSEAPMVSPFAGWAWHRAWADAAPTSAVTSSRALVLRTEDGRVGALLPFRISRTRFRRAPVAAVGWAVGDLGCPDHLDLPALPEADFDIVAAALERLPWDVMVLDNLAERAPNADRLGEACARRGWSVRRSPLWPCPYLELPESWDTYLAALTPTRRQTLRRKERNLHKRYTVELTEYGPERLLDGWQRLMALHASRWGGPGALGQPGVERLTLGFGSMLAARGEAWLTTLDLNGMPAAAWYGFALRDTVSFYQGGWDPQWERESVGMVLMAMMIRRAIEGGFRRFDFLRGEEPYKATWTQSARTCYELVVIRPGWRGVALRALDALATRRKPLPLTHA